jgi:hypothetical protein
LVRFWALDFCLPTLVCRPDEEAVAAVTTGFFARDLNPHFFDWPPLFMYLVTLALIPYAKYMKLTGVLRSEYRLLLSISANPAPIVMAARALSAVAGTATIALLHAVADRIAGRTTALIAALFLALSYLHARDSHFGVTDVSATLLALVVVWHAMRMTAATPGQVAIAAVITAAAAATKYNAGAAGLSAAWMIASAQTVAWPRRLLLLTLFGVMALGAFAAIHPYSLIESDAFLASMRGISTHLANGHGPDVGLGWWVHLSSSLRYGVGAPIVMLGIAGLAWTIYVTPRQGVCVALVPAITYLAIGAGRTAFSRYAIPLVPFVCLGAAVAIVEVGRGLARLASRPQLGPALAWTCAMLAIVPSATSVWHFNRLLGKEDSRIAAARWIEARFPDGASIGETEHRFNRLSFHDGTAAVPSKYRTDVLTPDDADPDVIVLADSPLHPGGFPPDVTNDRLSRYAEAFTSSAPERPWAVYDWQDEFYIPLAGINRLDRPGPRITVFIRKKATEARGPRGAELLLLERGVRKEIGNGPLRIRTHAQVVDVIANFRPPVRGAGGNDDDVADVDYFLHHVCAGDGAAARGTVEHLGDLAVGR